MMASLIFSTPSWRLAVEVLADKVLAVAVATAIAAAPWSAAAQSLLVDRGQARAEIVISETPERSVLLAAHELRTYVGKISGARLEIVAEPSGKTPVRIYIGRSRHTEQLGISAKELRHGAYRIVSGEAWLALIGDDTDFRPIEPWPRSNSDVASGKMQAAWNELTGRNWGYPHSQLHKHYSGPNSLFGTPDERRVEQDGSVNVWTYDERGSFNAVCGFLRSLGVRWYMPGDVGEIVPQTETIELPKIDRIVRPDFPLRTLNFRAAVYGRDAMIWGFRLGLRQPFGRQAAHGLETMTNNEHTLANHPAWFALYGGRRQTQEGLRLHQLCYSNDELFQEAVRFAQKQFDHYGMDVVSIMPPDGYTAMCQCELCAGKDSPQLGGRGSLSNYVWEFVNRVAIEVGRTHPGRMISNCAYGVYTEPPSNIAKLAPNVQVIIVGGRRPTHADRDELRRLRAAWAEKTDNPIEIFENYPFTGRGFYLPAFNPRVLGESINETKGVSRGEDIWLTMDFGDKAIGYNHFLIYFTARMYWGGKQADAAAMFDEYCRLFYGPAANEMRAFFSHCEQHWREMERDAATANRALELLEAAKAKALAADSKPSDSKPPERPRSEGADPQSGGPHSVYARRIQLIDNYLDGLRSKSVQLAQKRGPVPRLRLVSGSRGKIVIDGKLDDEPWQNCPVASTGRMAELQTGRQPTFGTSFKTEWIGDSLYFGIRCDETVAPNAEALRGDDRRLALNVATTKDEDPSIWYGDVVEILLDTESHSYYQIAVNPAGAMIDLDRGAERSNWLNWSSQAEVATRVADDHWTVEIRIPVTTDENDPLHRVVGRRPTQSLPWHVNVCRQRVRDDGSEHSAFSPTGTAGFHETMKFAHFYAGLSHEFDADATVADFVIDSRAAEDLMRRRQLAEALAAFSRLAAGDVTELQKSAALERAAAAARALKDFEQSEGLVARIPVEAVRKAAMMQHLLDQSRAPEVVERFSSEDIGAWPFWKRGDGYFARGRAYQIMKAGKEAESDLTAALQFASDTRARWSIQLALGNHRERVLKDSDGAMAAYRQILVPPRKLGGADEFAAVQGIARILASRGKFDEALAAIDLAAVEQLTGYWRHAMLLTRGQTLQAAGRKALALESYREVIASDTASASQRKAAQAAVRKLGDE